MTKLHKTATAFLLTAALLLSGCVEQGNSPVQELDNTSSDGNLSESIESQNSSEISDNSTPENSESFSDSESEPDLQTLIKEFPVENITLPDGSTVSKYEAANAHKIKYESIDHSERTLEFDFTFIRYAKPIFRNTFDEPDMIDWEMDTEDFMQNPNNFYEIKDQNYFKVKPGDKLENGLVVKSAKYWVDEYGIGVISSITFDGYLTLTGILYCNDGGIDDGELEFYGDPTQFSIPIIVPRAVEPDATFVLTNKKAEFALVFDDIDFCLGNINNIDLDISSVIDRGKYQKVKVTLNNITSHYIEGPNRSLRAELVSVEPIT